MRKISIFGSRSPIIVDFEMVALRSGNHIEYAVAVKGASRVMYGTRVLELNTIGAETRWPTLPCAFAPNRRRELAKMAHDIGFELFEGLVDPSAILPPGLRSGVGGFINAGVVMGAGCILGDGVLINRSASIGHHCIIGDWVSIGPGAILSGNVRVGANTMIGAGAVLQSDIRVGNSVRIATGSVVRKSVPDNAIVSGNPGKVLPARAVPSTLGREGSE